MAKDLGGVVFNDYSAEVLNAMNDAVVRALERCGSQAEGYAKDLAPVDTGRLRNSITHSVDDGSQRCTSGRIWSMPPMWSLEPENTQKVDAQRHGSIRTMRGTGIGRQETQRNRF